MSKAKVTTLFLFRGLELDIQVIFSYREIYMTLCQVILQDFCYVNLWLAAGVTRDIPEVTFCPKFFRSFQFRDKKICIFIGKKLYFEMTLKVKYKYTYW